MQITFISKLDIMKNAYLFLILKSIINYNLIYDFFLLLNYKRAYKAKYYIIW